MFRTYVDFDVTIYQASADGYMYCIRARSGEVEAVGDDGVFFPQINEHLIVDPKTNKYWVPDDRGYVTAKMRVHDLPSIYVQLNRQWRFFDFLATYGQLEAVDAIADESLSLYGREPEFPEDEHDRAIRTNQLLYIMLQLIKRYTRQASVMYTVPDNDSALSSRRQPLPGWWPGQTPDPLKRECFFMMGWIAHNLSAEVQKFEDHKLYKSAAELESDDYRYNRAFYDWPITQADYTRDGYAECHNALPKAIREGVCDYAWPEMHLSSKNYRDSDGDIDYWRLYEDGNDNGCHYLQIFDEWKPYWGRRQDGVVSRSTYL